MNSIRMATRASELALTQAEIIKKILQTRYPDLNIELVKITTQGDKILDKSLAKIGGKGLFIKELQEALLRREADLAVHSVKDLPYEQNSHLKLATLCLREDPRDVLLSRNSKTLLELKKGAIVGTSSLRRQMQVLCLRPDLECKQLRGNVPTRCSKLDKGEYDAIILAAAGLHRLKRAQHITEYLNLEDFLPAVGQGALGIECRADDTKTYDLLTPLHDQDVAACVLAERAMNKRLKGSCSVPIAGFAVLKNSHLILKGRVGLPDGKTMIESKLVGDAQDPESLGEKVADDLIAQGAREIIDACSKTE